MFIHEPSDDTVCSCGGPPLFSVELERHVSGHSRIASSEWMLRAVLLRYRCGEDADSESGLYDHVLHCTVVRPVSHGPCQVLIALFSASYSLHAISTNCKKTHRARGTV